MYSISGASAAVSAMSMPTPAAAASSVPMSFLNCRSSRTAQAAAMAKAHRESRALCYGDFRQLVLTNRQCIWERCADGERVLIAVNIDDQPYTAHFDAKCGRAVDLITGEPHDFGGGSELPPCSAFFWKCER